MRTLIALTLAFVMVFANSAAAQAPLKPEDFTYRGVINLSETGPFYQVPLPLPVYQGITHSDLGDLRIFNGQGELLPYALLRAESQTVSQRIENAAPIFPLLSPQKTATSGASGANDVSVTVRQGPDGTLVAVQPVKPNEAPVANTGSVVKGVVIDASALKGSIRSLRLVTGPSSEPFQSYSIESSDDLQSWRLLKSDAQLVHLEHNGQRIDTEEAEWDSAADRYLRLLWDKPAQAPEIKSVLLHTVETNFIPPARIWSEDIAPSSIQPEFFEYTWAGQMPLEKLRINLPQLNTFASLSIQRLVESNPYQSKHRFGQHRREQSARQPYWENLMQTEVYRYQSPQGEVKSTDIALHGPVLNGLRLVVDRRSGSIGSKPPTLQIGFVPHVLVFLARGDGPFTLAWGAKDVEAADMPASSFIPGYSATNTLKASPATLAVSTIVQQKPVVIDKVAKRETSSNKWVLWGVLLAGLLVLGGMAWSLSKQLRQPPAPKS